MTGQAPASPCIDCGRVELSRIPPYYCTMYTSPGKDTKPSNGTVRTPPIVFGRELLPPNWASGIATQRPFWLKPSIHANHRLRTNLAYFKPTEYRRRLRQTFNFGFRPFPPNNCGGPRCLEQALGGSGKFVFSDVFTSREEDWNRSKGLDEVIPGSHAVLGSSADGRILPKNKVRHMFILPRDH